MFDSIQFRIYTLNVSFYRVILSVTVVSVERRDKIRKKLFRSTILPFPDMQVLWIFILAKVQRTTRQSENLPINEFR